MASERPIFASYQAVYAARREMIENKAKMIFARYQGLNGIADYHEKELNRLREKVLREQGVLIDCV